MPTSNVNNCCFSGSYKSKCEGCEQECEASHTICFTLPGEQQPSARFCGACIIKGMRWAVKGALQAERTEAVYQAIRERVFVAEEGSDGEESDLSMAKRMLGLPE